MDLEGIKNHDQDKMSANNIEVCDTQTTLYYHNLQVDKGTNCLLGQRSEDNVDNCCVSGVQDYVLPVKARSSQVDYSQQCCDGQTASGRLEQPAVHGMCFDGQLASGRLSQLAGGQMNCEVDWVTLPPWSADTETADCSSCGHYTLPPLIPSVCPMDIRLQPRHQIGGIDSQMNLSAWQYYLSFEDNINASSYLHDGILNGFAIVDDDGDIKPYFCENYASVLKDDAFVFVDQLITSEIEEGKYVKASSVPHCVHSLGAIPKKDGS